MPRSLTPARQAEFDALYAVNSALVEFHRAELSPDMATAIHEVVETTYRERSLSRMRQLRDELLAATLPTLFNPETRRRLDAKLQARTGDGLAHHLGAREGEIQKIRDRGFITGDRQYYLLREHLELIAVDSHRTTEGNELRAMLDAYEARAAQRGRRAPRDPAA